ncbi:MAG: hypothetical protein QXN05_00230 [Acidilobaceae archaeon]
MSEYLAQAFDIIKLELEKYEIKIVRKDKDTFELQRKGETFMSVRDARDYVEISFKGKKYSYDKWYTKPQHLANTILNVLKYHIEGRTTETT